MSLDASQDAAWRRTAVAIRPATYADLPALCDLLETLFAQEAEFTPVRERQWAGLAMTLADPGVGRILVAERRGAVIGMAMLLYTVSTAFGGRAAVLEDMIVAPDARGAGVGTRLIEAAVAQARQDGAKRITLLTDADNLAAHRLYRKSGFVRSAMLPFRLALD